MFENKKTQQNPSETNDKKVNIDTSLATRRSRRTVKQLEKEILNALKLHDTSLSTSEIAEVVKCGYSTASKRLKKLHFDNKVEKFEAGLEGQWKYWKARR